jgi:hypothetical protein
MSDTTYAYTLSSAVLGGGSSVDLLSGTWDVTYNAAGNIVSVSSVDLKITDVVTGASTTYTAANINQSVNPSGTQYELLLTSSQSQTPFTGLFLDWSTETPTTLVNQGSHYTSTGEWNNGVLTPLTLEPYGTGAITEKVVCYCSGTHIRTQGGETPVEDLTVGQMVVTASGALRPIRWIGSLRVDLGRHPEPHLAQPVRIAAGALAEGVPARDLLVSPDHGILVDGALIPARLLVNHRSITLEDRWTAVTYYHVELDQHDILVAEGALAESYLDTGNRAMFDNGPVTVLRPDLSVTQRLRMPADGACMPLVTDTSAVLPVWQRLAARAGGMMPDAVAAAQDGVTLMIGSRTLRPAMIDGDRLVFALPRGVSRVRVVSAAARPDKARPWVDDRRTLGAAVTEVLADQTAIPLDGPAFGTGWWNVEGSDAGAFRWTNGNAELSLPAGTQLLTLRVSAMTAEVGAAKAA